MKIPDEIIPYAYDVAKRVHEGEIDRNEGIILLVEAEMNRSSAGDYINNFKCLVQGRRFTRALSTFSFKYFLDNIRKEYNSSTFIFALSALKEHIEYFENERTAKVNLHKVRELYESYRVTLPAEILNEQEQVEIVKELIKGGINKQSLLNELQKVKATDVEIIMLNGKAYKRNNKTIAQIKILRDFKCQICKKSIQKKDGTQYIEAAHINPKRLKGSETLDNIILLCPNHHKEFDLGNSVINKHTKSFVDMTINGHNFIFEFEINSDE